VNGGDGLTQSHRERGERLIAAGPEPAKGNRVHLIALAPYATRTKDKMILVVCQRRMSPEDVHDS